MIKVKNLLAFLVSTCCPFFESCTVCPKRMTKTNTSLKLWYRQPATKWTEALPVGNGRIGTMKFGGVDTTVPA